MRASGGGAKTRRDNSPGKASVSVVEQRGELRRLRWGKGSWRVQVSTPEGTVELRSVAEQNKPPERRQPRRPTRRLR